MSRRRSGRIASFALAGLLVAGAAGWEQTSNETDDQVLGQPRPLTALAPSTAQGSLWMCPIVADVGRGLGSLLVSVAGRPQDPAQVTVSLYGPAGVVGTQHQRVVGSAGLKLSVAELLASSDGLFPNMAAVVESSDPATVVASQLPGSDPVVCTTAVTKRWFIADGTTALDRSTVLTVFNPFPESAVLDLRFWTERGAARPLALQGIGVPGGSVRVIELGDYVRRRERISTEVVVRTGRVVPATRVTDRTGSSIITPTGLPAGTWFLPAGGWGDNRAEQFVLVNPNDTDRTVDLLVRLSATDAEPFQVSIPADTSVVFDPSADGRVPEGQRYSLVAQSSDGLPIVVQRTVRVSGDRTAFSSFPLASLTSERWELPLGGPGSVVVFNPFDIPTEVQVSVAGRVVGPAFTLSPGASRSVTINQGNLSGIWQTVQVTGAGAPVVVSGSTAGSEPALGVVAGPTL
jgi:hypothetical protein